MTLKTITKDLHCLTVDQVNMFFLEDGRDLCLIDTGFPNSTDAILAAIATLGRAPSDLKHIVLTHAHYDHIGSAAALVEATGAQTWMHPLDTPIAEGAEAPRPLKPPPGLLYKFLYRVFARSMPVTEPVKIDHLVRDGETFPFAGGLTVVHTPGHCAGQVALLWPRRNVLFAADVCTYVLGLGPPLGYEARDEGQLSQKKLANLKFEIAGFGHGKTILKGASQRFRKKWGSL